MTSSMQEARTLTLKRVRAGDSLHIQNIEFRVLSRHRQRKLVILELESSDGDRATLIGHVHART
ncbi:hypothetical protein [Arthrobacter sp. 49Tsu3.1M3]|jgi:hypothetical protein|uniref:hypothetical protein n=1 Tax=Arthrobacter sp. 49Tsu3.1M3 TaxID=1279029 RepID=UPI0011788AE0|nr:hypothetical protein [Arthrobacter sp. 49Tsu3.1M3]